MNVTEMLIFDMIVHIFGYFDINDYSVNSSPRNSGDNGAKINRNPDTIL